MKIAFHLNTICHRGTTVAVFDYAKYNQEILGNESVIVYPKDVIYDGVSQDSQTQLDLVELYKKKYNIYGYTDKSDLNKFCSNVDTTYFIKAGFDDGLLTDGRNVVHAVFQAKEPHGDRYAYISKWLGDLMMCEYVPHIVNLPEPNDNFRKSLGIPDDKIVIGRLGGFYQFDIPFVMQTIYNIVENDDRFVFVFVNTHKFVDHPNILFLGSFIDLQVKSNFINTCDAMIHARSEGETFGLAIAEGLFHNKPVFAWNNGRDKNHIEMLSGFDTLYDESNLYRKIIDFGYKYDREYYKAVKEFSPETVMNKFKQVFL